MSLPTGTILGQRYELRAFVGSDGTLDVYRGLDLRLGRDVALTVLEILTIHTPEELISFEKEAQVRAGLHHPRIMTVHDFGHGARCAFQVAEWLEGQSLRRRLQRGPLSWKEARDVGEAVIEGLVILLRKGYTLRVLDTTSVFLQYDGQVKLFAYQLRRIEGGDILKAQKEGLQTLAQVLLLALGDGQESLDATLAERILPHLRSWAGRTTLDASTLRREFEHLLQDQPPPVKRVARRRWLPGTALIIAVPVSVALYVQRTKLPPTPAPPPITGPKPVRDPEAQWLSLQGTALLETLEPDNLNRALTHLQSAITRDPRNATACSSLGKCYGLLGLQRLISREEALRQSRTALEHALALEPPSGEAHAALAFQKTWYELDWTGAEQEYRRALELAPDQVDILRDFGSFLALRGRWDESLEHFQAALERDPLSRLTRVQLALCLHWAGRSEEALEPVRQGPRPGRRLPGHARQLPGSAGTARPAGGSSPGGRSVGRPGSALRTGCQRAEDRARAARGEGLLDRARPAGGAGEQRGCPAPRRAGCPPRGPGAGLPAPGQGPPGEEPPGRPARAWPSPDRAALRSAVPAAPEEGGRPGHLSMVLEDPRPLPRAPLGVSIVASISAGHP